MTHTDQHGAGVVQYYDTHPINEEQILRTLRAKGVVLETLTEAVLKDYDQDHYGGVAANDLLAQRAGIQSQHLVLDVCSGVGGPSRYLAQNYGCRVVGLDFTHSRYEAAQRLTTLVKLDHLVSFRYGNALEMPFEAASFDVAIAQEAWCHVPSKDRLIAECARVVKPGGVVAFTDILRTNTLSDAQSARLAQEMRYADLGSVTRYATLLQQSGFDVESVEDLSEDWARILRDRLSMYRSLKDETIRRFGEKHYAEWDQSYSFFVGLYQTGELGGARFVARRR